MQEIINQIKEKIENAKNIALFGHTSTDGDCVGSICALSLVLENMGKNVEMFIDSKIPEYLKVVPNSEKINQNEFEIGKFDLLMSVDTATAFKLGEFGDTFSEFENTITIDHHYSNSRYAKLLYLDGNAPACGEVMFNFLNACGYKIDEKVASCLYAAIVCDTNNFTISDVRKQTFDVAGSLIDLGADFQNIVYSTQKVKTIEQLKVAGYMASHVKVHGEVAYLISRDKDCKKLHCVQSDFSKHLPLISDIAGTKITILVKQKGKNLYSISLRSSANYNVSNVASNFGGGGHINAAGCTVQGKIKNIIKQVFVACEDEIKKVDEADAK